VEDGIDGTNGYFRRNSGCSVEQKTSEFRSQSFRGRENNSEFRSVGQKKKLTLGIPFRTLPRKRKKVLKIKLTKEMRWRVWRWRVWTGDGGGGFEEGEFEGGEFGEGGCEGIIIHRFNQI
jgi:hypothetical protein